MTYRTKSCPYCKKVYSFMQPKGQVCYGSPIRTCEKCRKTFVDKDFVELGIFGNENIYYPQKVYPGTIYSFILFIIFSIAAFVFIETIAIKIIVSLALLGCGIFLLYSDIAEYDKSVEYFNKELAESKKRLSDPYYKAALKKIGLY